MHNWPSIISLHTASPFLIPVKFQVNIILNCINIKVNWVCVILWYSVVKRYQTFK